VIGRVIAVEAGSGARVLHLYLRHRGLVWLIDIRSKREKRDLSQSDLRAVREIVAIIKAEMA